MRRIAVLMTILSFCWSANLMAQNTFGRSGSSGNTGQTGTSGRDGENREIVADGSRISIQVEGSNGRGGSDGRDGSYASSCTHGTPTYNLEGARGGNGGNGGRGGQGGDGGDVTIYYEDIANLSSVYIDAGAGTGSSGGYSGRGGEGCRCQRRNWQAEVGGELQTFYCNDGARGVQGNNGSTGSSGSLGELKLISQTERLPPNIMSYQVAIGSTMNREFSFGVNSWMRKRGARQLLDIGSRVADSYLFFAGRREVQYSFDWQVERPVEDFANVQIYMKMNSQYKVTWQHSDGFWHAGEEVVGEDGKVTYTYSAVAKSSEVFDFSLGDLSGSDTDLLVSIPDNSGATKSFENKVHLSYYTLHNRRYYRHYSNTVPAEFVTVNDGLIEVAVGQLGIDARYLASGMTSYVNITLTRKMGGHSGSMVVKGSRLIP